MYIDPSWQGHCLKKPWKNVRLNHVQTGTPCNIMVTHYISMRMFMSIICHIWVICIHMSFIWKLSTIGLRSRYVGQLIPSLERCPPGCVPLIFTRFYWAAQHRIKDPSMETSRDAKPTPIAENRCTCTAWKRSWNCSRINCNPSLLISTNISTHRLPFQQTVASFDLPVCSFEKKVAS